MSTFLFVHPSLPSLAKLTSLLHPLSKYSVSEKVYLKDVSSNVKRLGFLYHNNGSFPFQISSPNGVLYEIKKHCPSLEQIDILSCNVDVQNVDTMLSKSAWLHVGENVKVTASNVVMGKDKWQSTHVMVNGLVSEEVHNHIGVYVGESIQSWDHTLGRNVDYPENTFISGLEKYGLEQQLYDGSDNMLDLVNRRSDLSGNSLFDNSGNRVEDWSGNMVSVETQNTNVSGLAKGEKLHVFRLYSRGETQYFVNNDDNSTFNVVLQDDTTDKNHLRNVVLFRSENFDENGQIRLNGNTTPLLFVVRDCNFKFETKDYVPLLPQTYLEHYELTKRTDTGVTTTLLDVTYREHDLSHPDKKSLEFIKTANVNGFSLDNYEAYKCSMGSFDPTNAYGPLSGYDVSGNDVKYLFEYSNKGTSHGGDAKECPLTHTPDAVGLTKEETLKEMIKNYFEINSVSIDGATKYVFMQLVFHKKFVSNLEKDIWVKVSKLTGDGNNVVTKRFSLHMFDNNTTDVFTALYVLYDSTETSAAFDMSTDSVLRVELEGNIPDVVQTDNVTEPKVNMITYKHDDDTKWSMTELDFYDIPTGQQNQNTHSPSYMKYTGTGHSITSLTTLTGQSVTDTFVTDTLEDTTNICNIITASGYANDFKKISTLNATQTQDKCYSELDDTSENKILFNGSEVNGSEVVLSDNDVYMRLIASESNVRVGDYIVSKSNLSFEGNSGVTFIENPSNGGGNTPMIDDELVDNNNQDIDYVSITLNFTNGIDSSLEQASTSGKTLYFSKQNATEVDFQDIVKICNPETEALNIRDRVIDETSTIHDVLISFTNDSEKGIKTWNNMIVKPHVWKTESGNVYSLLGYLISLFKKIDLVGKEHIDLAQYNPNSFTEYEYTPSVEVFNDLEIPDSGDLNRMHYFNLGLRSQGSDMFKLNNYLNKQEADGTTQMSYKLVSGLLHNGNPTTSAKVEFYKVNGSVLEKEGDLNLDSYYRTDDFMHTAFGYEKDSFDYILDTSGNFFDKTAIDSKKKVANNTTHINDFVNDVFTLDTYTLPSMSAFSIPLSYMVKDLNTLPSLANIPARVLIRKDNNHKNSYSSKTLVLYIRKDIANTQSETQNDEMFNMTYIIGTNKFPFNYKMNFDNTMMYIEIPLGFDVLDFTFNLASVNNVAGTDLRDYNMVFHLFDNESNPKYLEREALKFKFENELAFDKIKNHIKNHNDELLIDFVFGELKNWELNLNNIMTKDINITNDSFHGLSYVSNVSMTGYKEFAPIDSYHYITNETTKQVIFWREAGENITPHFDNRLMMMHFEKNGKDYSAFGVFSSELNHNDLFTKINTCFNTTITTKKTERKYICFYGKFLNEFLPTNTDHDVEIEIESFNYEETGHGHDVRKNGNTALILDMGRNGLKIDPNDPTNFITDTIDKPLLPTDGSYKIIDTEPTINEQLKVLVFDVDDTTCRLNTNLERFENDLHNKNVVDISKSIRLKEHNYKLDPSEPDKFYLRVEEFKLNGKSYNRKEIADNDNINTLLPSLLLMKNTILPTTRGQLYKLVVNVSSLGDKSVTTFKYKLLNEQRDVSNTFQHSNVEGNEYVVYLFNNGFDTLDIVDYARKFINTDIEKTYNQLMSEDSKEGNLINYDFEKAEDHAYCIQHDADNDEDNDLYMEELINYREHEKNLTSLKNGEQFVVTKLKNISESSYYLTDSVKEDDLTKTITETPPMHLMFYFTGVKLVNGQREKFVLTKDYVDSNYELSEIMTNAVTFKSYDQSLHIGDGTRNVVQLQQEVSAENTILYRVVDEGDKDNRYRYGSYNENKHFVPSATGFTLKDIGQVKDTENIGINIDAIDMCGVMSYQNINVPYERHNGVSITLNNNLKFLNEKLSVSSGYDGELLELHANMVIVCKNDISILGKLKTDVTNVNDIDNITYDFNDDVTENKNVLSKCKVNLYTKPENENERPVNEFDTQSDKINSEDMFVSLIVDMFKSDRLKLTTPVVVLHKNEKMYNVKSDIENELSSFVNNFDFTKSVMAVRRLCYYKYNSLKGFEIGNEKPDLPRTRKTYTLRWDSPNPGYMTLDGENGETNVIGKHLYTGTQPSDNDKKVAIHKFLSDKRSLDIANVWEIYKVGLDLKVNTYSLLEENVNESMVKKSTDTSREVGYKTDMFSENVYKHIDDKTGAGLDSNKEDIDPQRMTKESPLLNSVYNGTLNNYKKRLYTITPDDPIKLLEERELNGANAYLSGNMYTFKNVNSNDCGMNNVQVETLYFFTSLFKRSLEGNEKFETHREDIASNLTNAYWLLSDDKRGCFDDVPDKVLSIYKDTDYSELKTYRKALVSNLYYQITSEEEQFVNNFAKVEIPNNFDGLNAIYDGAHMVMILCNFKRSLVSLENKDEDVPTCKFPIIWYDDEHFYYFTSKTYNVDDVGETTNYDAVSKNYVHFILGGEAYVKSLLEDVAFHKDKTNTSIYLDNLQRYITTMRKYRGDDETNIKLRDLDDKVLNLNVLETEYNCLLKDSHIAWHEFYPNALRALFVFVNEGIAKFNNTRYIEQNNKGEHYREYIVDVSKNTFMGGSMIRLKSTYEKVPFTLDLSIKASPSDNPNDPTNYNMNGFEFVDNMKMRTSILDLIGKPQKLFIPLMLEFETADVEVIQSRKIEITTDYLLRALNKMPKLYLMNTIWYRVETDDSGIKTRKLFWVGDINDSEALNNVGDDEIPTLDVDYEKVNDETLAEVNGRRPFEIKQFGLAKYMYDILMGKGTSYNNDDNTLIKELLLQHDYGRLKLDDVRDDPTNRGGLKDYRYHGDRYDEDRQKPYFADNTPSTCGGFAMQVIRMIKSGLINKPEDIAILGNEQAIVNKIRNNLKNDPIDIPAEFKNSNYSNIIQELNYQLTRTKDTSTNPPLSPPLQSVIDQLYINDHQRFVVNEQLQESSNFSERLKHEGDPVYMLPLTSEDTFTIITTIDGSLRDPFDGKSTKIDNILQKLDERLRNPADCNPANDMDDTDINFVSLTGTPLKSLEVDSTASTGEKGAHGTEGVYKHCKNILIDPAIGPLEKEYATILNAGNGNTTEHGKNVGDVVKWVGSNGAYHTASDADKAKYDGLVIQPPTGVTKAQNVIDKYLKLKERSFTIMYGLEEINNTNDTDYYELRNELAISSLYENGTMTIKSKESNTPSISYNFLYDNGFDKTSNDLEIEGLSGEAIKVEMIEDTSGNNYILRVHKNNNDVVDGSGGLVDTIGGLTHTFIKLQIPTGPSQDKMFITKVNVNNTDSSYLDLILLEHYKQLDNALHENDDLPDYPNTGTFKYPFEMFTDSNVTGGVRKYMTIKIEKNV